MADLRTELEMYAAADEPPMRMTFDDVFTAARRNRQRRRSLIIASGVAAVVAVAVAVPVAIHDNAPATSPLRTTCPVADKSEHVRCVVNKFLTDELPDVRFDPTEVQVRGDTYQASIVATGTESSLRLSVSRQTPPQGCADREAPGRACDQRVGPNGEKIVVIHYPDMTEPDRTAVEVSSSAGTSSVTVHQVEQKPERLLRVEQLTRLVTTPELLP